MQNATICIMPKKTYSLLQAAEKAGIHRLTLIRWLQKGYVKPSTEVTMPSGNILRLFTDSDIEKIRSYKAEHYWDMPESKSGKK